MADKYVKNKPKWLELRTDEDLYYKEEEPKYSNDIEKLIYENADKLARNNAKKAKERVFKAPPTPIKANENYLDEIPSVQKAKKYASTVETRTRSMLDNQSTINTYKPDSVADFRKAEESQRLTPPSPVYDPSSVADFKRAEESLVKPTIKDNAKAIAGGLVRGIPQAIKGIAETEKTLTELGEKYQPEWMKKVNNAISPITAEKAKETWSKTSENMTRADESLKEKTGYNDAGSISKYISDLSASIPQMGMLFVPGGQAVFGASAGGNYMQEAEQKGASLEQKAAYGAIGGAAEVALEGLLKTVPGIKKVYKEALTKGSLKAVGKQAIKSSASEGIEEAAIDPVMGLTEKAIIDKDKKWLGKDGVVDISQMAYDFMGGAIMGGMINSPALIKSATDIKKAKAYVEEAYPEAMAYAEVLPEEMPSKVMAEEIKSKGQSFTVQEVVDLENAVKQDIKTLVESQVQGVQENVQSNINVQTDNVQGATIDVPELESQVNVVKDDGKAIVIETPQGTSTVRKVFLNNAQVVSPEPVLDEHVWTKEDGTQTPVTIQSMRKDELGNEVATIAEDKTEIPMSQIKKQNKQVIYKSNGKEVPVTVVKSYVKGGRRFYDLENNATKSITIRVPEHKIEIRGVGYNKKQNATQTNASESSTVNKTTQGNINTMPQNNNAQNVREEGLNESTVKPSENNQKEENPAIKKAISEVKKTFKDFDVQITPAVGVQKDIEKLMKSLGTNVVFYKPKNSKANIPNGFYKSGNTIFVQSKTGNNEARNVMMQTAGHEFFHTLRTNHKSLFNELIEFGKQHFNSEAREKFLKDFNNNPVLQEQYRSNNDLLIEEMLAEELGNNFVDETFWQSVKSYSEKLFDKLVDVLKNILNRISGTQYDTYIGKKTSKELKEEFAKMVAKVKNSASEEDVDSVTAADDNIAPMYSVRTHTEEDKENVVKYAKENGIASRNKVLKYLKSIDNVMAKILNDPDRLDYTPSQDYSAMKPNADPHYKESLDFSTLCKKRLILQGTIEKIQSNIGRGLTQDEWIDVRNALNNAGVEVSCGACYVDTRRMEWGLRANQYVKDNLEAGKWYDPKGAKGNDTKWTNKPFPKNPPPKEWFFTQPGLDKLKAQYPEVYSNFLEKTGARGIKTPESRTEYRHEVLKLSKGRVEALNSKAGLRWQSWSDFETPHLMDGMQVIADMFSRGMKGHAYTKVENFVKVFGKTNMMINMSLIPKGKGVDAEGNLVFDSKEGMDVEVAKKYRNTYDSNVGTITIGVNDEQIRAALRSDYVDYVIPYHASGLSKSKRIALGIGMDQWTDYTRFQNPKEIVKGQGKASKNNLPDIYEVWDNNKTPKENADEYVRQLNELGYNAPFSQFLDEPNYWKTLIDHRMVDGEGKNIVQQPVVPEFDMNAIEDILDSYNGEHDSLPFDNKAVEELTDKFSKRTKSTTNSRLVVKQDDVKYSAREKQTETESFKKWFGDSKVVDEDGVPKRVYHGGGLSTFTKFDKQNTSEESLYGAGFYFTEDSEIASSYTKSGNSRAIMRSSANAEERAAYFKPGRIIKGYSGFDKVLEYFPGNKDKSWYVVVVRVDENGNETSRPRVHYTDPTKAEVYKALNIPTEAPGILPVFLKIENPIDVDKYALSDEEIESLGLSELGNMARRDKERGLGASTLRYGVTLSDIYRIKSSDRDYDDYFYDLRENLQELGFDGITHMGGNYAGNGEKPHRVWIAFESNQIKSATGNNGEFSSDNDDIRYSDNERRHHKQYQDADISDPDFIANISEDSKYYDKISINGNWKEAFNKVIKNPKKYEAEVMNAENFTDSESAATAEAVLFILQKQAVAMRDMGRFEASEMLFDRVAAVAEKIDSFFTKTAQTLNMGKIWGNLTPEGQLRKAQREIEKTRTKKQEKILKEEPKQIAEILNNINLKAAQNVFNEMDERTKELMEIMDLVEARNAKKIAKAVSDDLSDILGDLDLGDVQFAARKAESESEAPKVKLARIVEEHYSMSFAERGSLAEKLSNELGIGEEQANVIAKRINDKMKEVTQEDKAKMMSDLDKKPKKKRESKAKEKKEAVPKAKQEPIPAEQLANKVKGHVLKKDTKENDPIKNMVNTLYKVAKKTLPEKAKNFNSPMQFVVEAIKNKEQYRQVWEEAKGIVKEKLNDDTEALNLLDEYFETMLDKPFSEKQMEKGISQGMKDLKIRMNDIIKEHFSVQDAVGNSLTEKFIKDLGLDEDIAEELAYEVEQKFKEMTTNAKKRELERMLKKVEPKTRKTFIENIVELSNLGSADASLFKAVVAKKHNIQYLDSNMQMHIIDMANRLQTMRKGTAEYNTLRNELEDYMTDLRKHEVWEHIANLETFAMIGNTKTASRNISGNMLSLIEYDARRFEQALLDIGRHLIFRKERQVLMPNPWIQAKGMYRGFREELTDVIKNRDSSERDQSTELRGRIKYKGVMGIWQRVVRILVTDRPFHEGILDELMVEAKNLARINGVKFDEKAAMEVANAEADEVFFADMITPIQRVLRIKRLANFGKSGAWGIGTFIMKFTKVPLNITKWSIERIPEIAMAKMLVKGISTGYSIHSKTDSGYIKNGKFNQRAFGNDLMKYVNGKALVTLGAWMLSNGMMLLNDDEEKNKSLFALMKDTGLNKYQLNISAIRRYIQSGGEPQSLKVGDNLQTFDWAVPISPLLIAGAKVSRIKNTKDASSWIKETDSALMKYYKVSMETLKGASEGMVAGFDAILDQPMLKGIRETKYEETTSGKISKLALMIPGRFVPSPVNQARQLKDNVQRDTYDRDPIIQTAKQIQAKTPGKSALLPPKVRTVGGEDRVTYQDGSNSLLNVMINPSYSTKYNPSKEEKLILDLYELTKETAHVPTIPDRKIDITDATWDIKTKNETVELTPNEYVEYQRILGKEVKSALSKMSINKSKPSDTVKEIDKKMKEISADVKEKMLQKKGYKLKTK